MKRSLALLHTSPVVVPAFQSLCEELLNGVDVFHLVDESLIKNTIRAGRLEKITIRRVINLIENARLAGADAVLLTCSSVGPAVPLARELFDFPILRIDEPMVEQAIQLGQRLGVLATLATTLEPTVQLIEQTASERGLRVTVEPYLCEGAFDAILRGDSRTHDQLVARALAELETRTDVIVLAQASTAQVLQNLPCPPARPVLSSPRLAVLRARQVLQDLDQQPEQETVHAVPESGP